MSKSCADCAFFEDHKTNSETVVAADDAGLCRFNPPVSQPEASSHGLWPVVKTDDWCGHFEEE
ncbi:hypothetical protein [Thioclava sp. GXIMD4215]|uniref:hypothetical protein n=1 Tax=Thioclava sp. GXIMD4215 TaxID=3131928 RepID=UPI00311B19BA